MVGSALVRALKAAGKESLLLRTSVELDLRDMAATLRFVREAKPAVVIMAAARVGGIRANSEALYDFLHENLVMSANVIEASRLGGVRKLLYLGSSCIYPKAAPQPISEDALLTGPLEPTNEGYALAKIAGIRMCDFARRQHGCDFISAMPCNLYGPGDNFSLEKSHVLPAMIRKMHDAKLRGDRDLLLWGTGTPLREFLHADDLAQACLFLLSNYAAEGHVNVGAGSDLSIRDLASLVAKVVGFSGELRFDPSKPDGTYRKLMDSSKIRSMGWAPRISLEEGIRTTYDWFLREQAALRL
jgi:GDP-L-fucose synthase